MTTTTDQATAQLRAAYILHRLAFKGEPGAFNDLPVEDRQTLLSIAVYVAEDSKNVEPTEAAPCHLTIAAAILYNIIETRVDALGWERLTPTQKAPYVFIAAKMIHAYEEKTK